MSFWKEEGFGAVVPFGDVLSAARSRCPCEGLFMPSVARKIQQQFFGLKNGVSGTEVSNIEGESGLGLPEILRNAATAASQQYPPLCSVLEQLVSTLELSNKELVLAALRDKQVPFDVLAKESTGSLTSFFECCGICNHDARTLSLVSCSSLHLVRTSSSRSRCAGSGDWIV